MMAARFLQEQHQLAFAVAMNIIITALMWDAATLTAAVAHAASSKLYEKQELVINTASTQQCLV